MAKINYNHIFDKNVKEGLENIKKSVLEIDKTLRNLNAGGNLKDIATANKLLLESEKQLQKERENRLKIAQKIQQQEEKDIRAAKQRQYNSLFAETIKKDNELIAAEKKLAAENQKLINSENRLIELQNKNGKSLKELAEYNNLLMKRRRELNVNSAETRKEFDKLTVEIAKNNKILKSNDAQIGNFQRNVGNYKSVFDGLKNSLMGFSGALGIAGGIAFFAQQIKSAFNIVTEFDAKFTELLAIMGATEKDSKPLKQTILDLGASTKFTASEVANAATELAKLGFTSKEIQASLKGVLDGAVAMGAGIPETAELVSKSIAAFGLSASDSEAVAATFASSANQTALSFQYLADSMPYAATAAKTFGFSLEQTTAMLGILADNGIQASSAGVAIRDMLSDLSSKGISFEDAMTRINTSTNKAKTAFDIFGKTSMNQAIILAENTGRIDELTKSVTNQEDALAKLVAQRIDTIEGQTQILQSAWEGMILSFEDGSGKFAGFAKKVLSSLTEIINSFTKGNEITRALEVYFDAIAQIFTPIEKLLKAFGLLSDGGSKLELIIKILGNTLLLSTAPFRGLMFLVTKLVELITYLAEGYTNLTEKSVFLKVAFDWLLLVLLPIPKLIYEIAKAIGVVNAEIEQTNTLKNFGIDPAKFDKDIQKQLNYLRAFIKERDKLLNKEGKSGLSVAEQKDLENLNAAIASTERYIRTRTGLSEIGLKNALIIKQETKEIKDNTIVTEASNEAKKESVKSMKEVGNAFGEMAEKAAKNREKMFAKEATDFEKRQQYLLDLVDFETMANEARALEEGKSAEEIAQIQEEGAKKRLAQEYENAIELLEFTKKRNKDMTKEELQAMDNMILALKLKMRQATPGDGKSFLAELFGISDEDAGKLQGELEKLYEEVDKFVDFYLDKQIEIQERKISDSQNMQDQIKQELDAEINSLEEKKRAGVAYDTQKKQRLEKDLREQQRREREAMREKERLSKIQKSIDIAQTIGAGALAVVKALQTKPTWLGIALAAIVGTTAALQVAKISATKYAKGGYGILQGKSHAEGGIPFDNGTKEAEGGEAFSVFSKTATRKHGKLIEYFTNSINQDKTINFENINRDKEININFDNKTNETYLRKIAENTQRKEYVNSKGHKVVKSGNITTTYN